MRRDVGWVVLRTLELPWGRGGFGLRKTGKAAQMGFPPSAHRGSKPVEGDGSYICRPTPCAPLIIEALLL